MRDFRTELAGERFWDADVEAIYRECGEPRVDAILQHREEVLELCAFIEAKRIRSYLEIGLWTGRLLTALSRIFAFDRIAGCDDGYARRLGLALRLPAGAEYFEGDSTSAQFADWRRKLGPIDLVLIDANHHYRGVAADFAANRQAPHRFLALHDITGANRHTVGVRRLWQEIDDGNKREIIAPASGMGIGVWSATEAV